MSRHATKQSPPTPPVISNRCHRPPILSSTLRSSLETRGVKWQHRLVFGL
ncbi:hypothetical protein HanXRQr2_Chr10g0428321 [Helianthus annuus]|uniref:Uncharacterized protein n=1 Tax=Helianthus annuus TaxID=4232 RepID=A0A9K3HVB6_HELAN|nr:hypothetical protein HanXRQr2_Chr10g0428321 [Helianthus annuus]